MERILVVDDDIELCRALSEELGEIGFEVSYSTEAESALEYVGKTGIDLMLLDLKMPDKDGFYVLRKLHDGGIKLNIIVLTAFADVKSAIEAAKLGATDFVSKPYDFDELLCTIRKVLNKD